MTIRFKCPGCQKTLGVKDHLAGKKANCPVCKRPFVIPRPKRPAAAARPVANAEELAAQALADPKEEEQPKQAATTIDFMCDWCAEDVKVGLEEAGKQIPCPHCKRIVKVPRPKVEPKKNDWRAPVANDKPAWAKENALQQTLVGATTKGTVSGEALREADAFEEVEEEPLTRGQKIARWVRRGAIAAGVLGLLAAAWYGAKLQQSTTRQQNDMGEVLLVFKTNKPLPPAWQSELHRAAGEFYLRKNTKKDRDEALKHFHKALAAARDAGPREQTASRDQVGGRDAPSKDQQATECDLALGNLAVSMIELGGNADEILEKSRLNWEDVQTEVSRALLAISSPEGRALAMRNVGNRLLDMGKGEMAVGLAKQLSKEGPGGAGQQVAFLLALKREDDAGKELPLPPRGAPLDLPTRIGYAEGYARLGDYEKARQQAAAQPGLALDRLQALVGVAAVAAEQNRVTEASAVVDDAVRFLLDGELKKKKVAALLLLPLARAAVRSHSLPGVKALTEALPDPSFVGQVELATQLQKLQADSSNPPDPTTVKENTLAHAQYVEAVARAKTRNGRRTEVLNSASGLEEQVRPFAFVGAALGEQDTRR